MSTVHGSPFWDQSQAVANKVVQQERLVYLWAGQGVSTSSILIYLYGKIMDMVFDEVIQEAKNRIGTVPAGNFFFVDPTQILEKKMKGVFLKPHPKGFEPEAVERVRKIASEYIISKMGVRPMVASSSVDVHPSSSVFFFDYGMSPAQLDQKKKELVFDYGSYIFPHVSSLTPLGFDSYSDSDLAFLGARGLPKPEDLSCFHYALLKVCQTEAKIAIRNLKQITPTIDILHTWGYRSVERPDEGDLVVYFTKAEGLPQHIGIYCEDGQVESKWGVNGHVYKHGLFEVPPNYGRTVVFMRKSRAKLV